MEFSNLYFLYILLPISLLVYFLMPDMRRKNMTLLVVSLLFYAMGQPLYLLLMVALSYLNFRMAHSIDPHEPSTLVLPVAVNIGVLVIFKYLDFFLGIFGLGGEDGVMLGMAKGIVTSLNAIGFSFQTPSTVLPVGISFYIFSVISYMADVYRGKVAPEQRFSQLMLYLLMFPKLLQGPIVRYTDVAEQLQQRRHHPRMVFEGAQRFIMGLAKKVLLADYCGTIISEMRTGGGDTTLVGVWFVAILYMFQIYFDFSGYSDMAIGLGRIFGFRYCENFDRPYMSLSITEFWRRWHISLGSFFRDYVYIPLGGNRRGKVRQIGNMLVVWALTGLWHGASWNYVIWGLYFFVLLAAEKQLAPMLETLPDWGRRCITLFLVLIGWIIFSHEDLSQLGAAFAGMLGYGGLAAAGTGTRILNALPLMAVCFIGCTDWPQKAGRIFAGVCGMSRRRKQGNQVTALRAVYIAAAFGVMCLLLWLCTVSLVGSTSAPSIYGNF